MDEINDLYVYFKSNYRKPEDNEFYGVVTGFVKNKEIFIDGKTFTSDVYKCDIFPGQGIEIEEGTDMETNGNTTSKTFMWVTIALLACLASFMAGYFIGLNKGKAMGYGDNLIEEIVGEIRDEFDDDEMDLIHAINEHEYDVDGSVKLDDLNDVLGTEFESEDYDSIGGYLIEHLDHLPVVGDKVETDDGIKFEVLSASKKRVGRVYIDLSGKKEKTEEE